MICLILSFASEGWTHDNGGFLIWLY